jgi:hypothetical protein
VHARSEEQARWGVAEVLAAYEIGDVPAPERPLLLDVVA